MKRVLLSVMAIAAICWLGAPAWAAEGLSDQPATYSSASTGGGITIAGTFRINGADHVVNGTALRNRCSGNIPLRGVPLGSSVVAAYLYWNFMDGSAAGSATDTALFNGNLVTGSKTADHPDLCWGTLGDHTYRATVSTFVPSSKPNGDYTFGAIDCNDSTGQNPWVGGSIGPVKWEGASLVVVYRNASTSSDVVIIYDKLAGADANVTASPFTVNMTAASPFLTGSGLFSEVGADGQTGTSFSSASTNETDTFNGALLAGPTGIYPQSNWDGSTGWPMPELYDNHAMDVSFSGTSTNTNTTTNGTDCIAAVVYVLQQGGF